MHHLTLLLIEGDPDLEYLKEVNERYGSKEFLVLTYSPMKKCRNGDLQLIIF